LTSRNDAFRSLLDTLNSGQRRAVDAIEGPVLVVAGPGTGKTHILAARVGKILLETDTRPQNVLCLTFTDAAVNAMRARLLEMIGPDAYRVPISTFHGFCNRVIQENMEYFGHGNLEPVSDLERIEIVRDLLAKLPPEHPLREGRKNAFAYENHLRDLFVTMKKEDWTPGLVLKTADMFVQSLPGDPAYTYQRNTAHARKGDPKTEIIAEMTTRMERLKAAADLYPKYLHAMERAGRYEYEDMILWVLRAFQKHEALLRSYQERYLYVQVDEFQDTNGAQYHLLRRLLEYWESPNAFIVGDDDQSIYEFQGARLGNLLDFHERYRAGLEIVVLTENYRSTQPVLDSAAGLIARNTLRAVRQLDEPLEKNLHAHTSETGELLLRSYKNRLCELTDVVAQIEALIRSGTSPEEIAVIYAKHRQADRLMALLGKKNIAFQAKRPVNALDLPLVQQLRELLCYLDEESRSPYAGEHRLFRLLHADFFGLDAGDLARIAANSKLKTQNSKLLYDTPGAEHYAAASGYWRDAVTSPEYLSGLSLRSPDAFDRIARLLDGWIGAVHNLPLPQLLERLFTQTGLLDHVLGHPDKQAQLQALHTFFNFVLAEVERRPRFFAPKNGAPAGLTRLLDLLDSMDENRLTLPLEQAVQSGPGVQLLTAHGAKGLEFRHVFLFDCTEDAWEKNTGGNNKRFALPPTLLPSGEEDALEARRRLFYVAMTRAKRRLHISFARAGDGGRALAQSMFVAETSLPVEQQEVAQSALLDTQALLLLAPEPAFIELPEPVVFEAMMADFSLSITALNRYLRCPVAFYYEDFLKIPGATSESAAYGIAMHGALQQFLLKMKSDKKLRFPSAEMLVRLFSAEMERQRGYFSENNYAQRLALGRDNLRRLHAEQVPYWRKRAIAERRVDRVELDGVPLTGVLDKIEWLDNGTLRVVDYKTGVPDPQKTAAPGEKHPHGGDYWRQMAFYRILLEQARIYPEPVGKTVIQWLEPDRRGNFVASEIAHTGEQIRFVEGLIRETWANIRAAKFTPGCDLPDCPWCRMHRWKEAPEAGFGREREEGLDDG
jgi:DNA helicase-2/ATP-dependent DNA helicase PcrA